MPLDEKIRDSTLQPFDNELKEIKIGSTYEGGLKLDEVSNSVGVGFDHLGVLNEGSSSCRDLEIGL